MIEIALAKNWKLENIEPIGNDEFVFEVNRQVADLILKLKKENENNTIEKNNQKISRVKTYTQNLKEELENKELNKSIDLKELKENLDAKLVLEYAKENFKLDISNFKITNDNKIDNLKNKQKPKNVIDFLQKELNLSTKEAIWICKEIYKNDAYYNKNKRRKYNSPT